MPIWGLSTESDFASPPPDGGKAGEPNKAAEMAGEGGGSRKARLAPTLHEPKGRARRARGTVIRHVFGAPFRLAVRSAQGPEPFTSS